MEKFIILILFLLPVQTQWILHEGMLRGELWQYGAIGIFGVDILIMLLVIGEAWKIFALPGPRGILMARKLGTIGWWVVAFFLSVLFSVIPAQDTAVAWLHTCWVAEAIAMGCIIAHAPKSRLMQAIFCSGSVVQAVLGLWQFFTQSTIASSLLGLAAHPIWEGGTSVVESDGGRWLRAYAGFPHPNFFGGWMAIAIVLTVGLVLSESRVKVRGLLLTMLVALSGGLAASLSRSAWIAVGVGLVILFVLRFRQCEPQGGVAIQNFNKKLFASIVIIFISMGAILLPYHSLLQTRVEHSARLEQRSLNEREQQYAQAWELVRAQRWGRGEGYRGVTGIGNYTLAVSNRHSAIPIFSVQPVHNAFVLMAAETHTGSLIWVFLIFYYCLKRALGITPLSSFRRHWYKQLHDPRCALPLALLGALVPLLLLDHYLWSLHTGLLLWGVTMGWVYSTFEYVDQG